MFYTQVEMHEVMVTLIEQVATLQTQVATLQSQLEDVNPTQPERAVHQSKKGTLFVDEMSTVHLLNTLKSFNRNGFFIKNREPFLKELLGRQLTEKITVEHAKKLRFCEQGIEWAAEKFTITGKENHVFPNTLLMYLLNTEEEDLLHVHSILLALVDHVYRTGQN